METVYVIIGATGEYSDHNEWPVCWRESLEEAEALVAKLNEEAKAYKEWENAEDSYDYKKRDERRKAMTDPYFACDYTGTTYHVWNVSKEPRK